MSDNQAADLEAALLARAEALASEHLNMARHRREEIRAESSEHLKVVEERELLAAKAAADKLQRQMAQAAEIRLQGEFDRLRWTLVQSVLTQLDEKTSNLASDEAVYLPMLAAFIAAGARAIDHEIVIVALNARDLSRVGSNWQNFANNLAPGKQLELAHEPIVCAGGVLLHDPDNRVRVDHTFEGRKQRLEEELARVVMEQLFAGAQTHG
jgi:V/A-type H+-transporting ATPase subunit E